MRASLIPVALAAVLATGMGIEPLQARGCIKGALAGGLAGHAVGHGFLGAAGGCVAGRSLANRSARQQTLQNQQNGQGHHTSPDQPSSYAPSTQQGYSGPATTQGYPPARQGQGYTPRTTAPSPFGN